MRGLDRQRRVRCRARPGPRRRRVVRSSRARRSSAGRLAERVGVPAGGGSRRRREGRSRARGLAGSAGARSGGPAGRGLQSVTDAERTDGCGASRRADERRRGGARWRRGRATSLWSATMPVAARVGGHAARRVTSTSTWRSSVAGFTGLWTALSLATARSDAADRRARTSRRRVRGERPQRRVVLGAAGDEPARLRRDARAGGGRSPPSGRCTRPSTRSVASSPARPTTPGGTAAAPSRTPAPPRSIDGVQDDVDEARAFGFGDERPPLARRRRARRRRPPARHRSPPRSRRTARRCTRCASSTPSPAPRPAPAWRCTRSTAVEVVEPRRLVTSGGTVRADVVVLATEAYTATHGRPPSRRWRRCTR